MSIFNVIKNTLDVYEVCPGLAKAALRVDMEHMKFHNKTAKFLNK